MRASGGEQAAAARAGRWQAAPNAISAAIAGSAARRLPISGSSTRVEPRHKHLGLHRLGDEALLVRPLVQARFFFVRRSLVAAVDDPRIERYRLDPGNALLVGGHVAHGLVLITLDLEASLPRYVQEGQHVTARQR